MTVAFVGSSTAIGSGGATTLALTDPGIAGAFLIVCIEIDREDAADYVTPPDGTWTQLYGYGAGINTSVWTKASATGSGSYVFGNVNGWDTAGQLRAYTGVANVDVSARSTLASANGPSWNIVAPSVTTTVPNCMWVGVFDLDTYPNDTTGGDTFTVPGGFANPVNVNYRWISISMCDVLVPSAGATGTATGIDTRTGVTSSGSFLGYSIALAPASGAPSSSFFGRSLSLAQAKAKTRRLFAFFPPSSGQPGARAPAGYFDPELLVLSWFDPHLTSILGWWDEELVVAVTATPVVGSLYFGMGTMQ